MQRLSRVARRWAGPMLQPHSSSPAVSVGSFLELLGTRGGAGIGVGVGVGIGAGIGALSGVCARGFAAQGKGKSGSAGALVSAGGGGDKENDGEDEDPDEKPQRRGKKEMVEIRDEDIESEPMDYYFYGVAPDHKAACLSDKAKEKMWRAYQDNPVPEMVDRLAQTFKIRKQRVHAILWLKDIEKEELASGKVLATDLEEYFEQVHGTYETADNERHYALPSTKPDFEVLPEGWQGTVKDESQSIDEISAKEEEMMVQEFERRMNFNKMEIAGLIKTNKLSRSRPPEGWSYLIEELGDEGKRGKRGGRRYVALPDGSHRGLNELEKVFLQREKVRPRRRLTPR